jgi:hypothetical protein
VRVPVTYETILEKANGGDPVLDAAVNALAF